MRPAWRFQVVLFGNFVILNLFLAILMSSFDEQRGKLHDALALGPYWALLLQPLQLLQLCSQVDQRGRLPMHQQALESKRELTRVWHPENLTNTSHHRFQSFPVQVHQRVQVQVWVLHGSTNQTFPLRLLAVSTCFYVTSWRGNLHRTTLGLGEWSRLVRMRMSILPEEKDVLKWGKQTYRCSSAIYDAEQRWRKSNWTIFC